MINNGLFNLMKLPIIIGNLLGVLDFFTEIKTGGLLL
jgi:hypothetical protein